MAQTLASTCMNDIYDFGIGPYPEFRDYNVTVSGCTISMEESPIVYNLIYGNLIKFLEETDATIIMSGSTISQLQSTDALPEEIVKRIGEGNHRRFEEFRDEYEDGWDYGRGKALNNSSTATLIWFLEMHNSLEIKNPSLFFTRNGNLQLVWDDFNEGEIEIEFYPDKLRCYIDKLELEGEFPLDQASRIVELIGA